MSAERELSGRHAVVTGAGGDIGRAIARELTRQGASTTLVGRRIEPLRALADELAAAGGEAHPVSCDVTDDEQVARMVAEVLDRSQVDILVNNAGGARFVAPALDVGVQGWRKIFELNTTAPFVLSQAFGGHMATRGRGAIVNVGSISGLRHLPGMVAYSSAKAALFQQTRALAQEWAGSGVRVNAVAPGFVDTSGWDAFDKDAIVEAVGLRIPLGRWATADEIARPVAFLASDAASYITGVVLPIEGGMLS